MPEAYSPESGLFVTNHLNMMFCLASGFIPPPSGFGDKYYKDTLSERPGWLPLFLHKRKLVPRSAIDLSIEEAEGYLIPVIVEISLEGLEHSESETNSFRLTRLPISITQIIRIYVESNSLRDKILSQIRLRNNVFLKPGILRRRKTSFTKALKRMSWQSRDKMSATVQLTLFDELLSLEGNNIPVHLIQAAGGILATLHHIENQGEEVAQAYKMALEPRSQDSSVPGMCEWMLDGHIIPKSESVDGYLLWSLVGQLAEYRSRSSDRDLDNIVLNFLEDVSSEIQDQTKPICNTLYELGELGGSTIQEYFDLHKSPLARALILFFLRRHFQELFELDNEKMSDMDWVYSAILFGARSGWLRLPKELRGKEEFRNKVCDWMIAFCHRLMNR